MTSCSSSWRGWTLSVLPTTLPSSKLSEHPLAVCLKILQGFGPVGQAIWELGKWYTGELEDGVLYKKNKHVRTAAQRLAYLQKAILNLKAKVALVDNWRELPV